MFKVLDMMTGYMGTVGTVSGLGPSRSSKKIDKLCKQLRCYPARTEILSGKLIRRAGHHLVVLPSPITPVLMSTD